MSKVSGNIILQRRSSLALCIIFGSSISYIPGAFSLGLIFLRGEVRLDGSTRIYAAWIVGVTSLIVGIAFVGVSRKGSRGVGYCGVRLCGECRGLYS